MNFVQSFTATESGDGKTITITDTSNWIGNDQSYAKANFVRTFILRDAYGEVLDTIVLGITEDTATYAITVPQWIAIQFTIDGVVDFSKIQEYPFQRIFDLDYIAIKVKSCCGSSGVDLCQINFFRNRFVMCIPPYFSTGC